MCIRDRSIQAHPSRSQAKAGFAREEEEGIRLDDPTRNYKDPNHKPELIVALTPFQALAGFRPFSRTAELLAVLDAPGLNRYTTMVDPEDEEASLRALFTTLISLPRKAAVALVEEVEQRAREVVQGELEEWMREVLTMYLELVEAYPGDIGALAALLLNYFNLQPGEALYLDAGQLHAYQPRAGRGDHGELRQRAARRPDLQAR